MNILTGVYLFYILVSLYFSLITLMVYFKNKERYFEQELEDYTPKLSVIVPAYNEEETIGSTLRCILENDYPKENFEVIVVNDGSTDRTEEIVKGFKEVKLLSKENTGKADSLNKAIKIAKGELIAIVDSDSYPEKDAFRKMSGYFIDKDVGAVTGTVLVKNRRNLMEKMQAMEYTLIAWTRRILDFLDSVFVTPGALSMYRKSALEKIGGFDKNIMTEDIEVAWNLLKHRYKVRMESGAYAFTMVPSRFKQWWRQRIRWSVGGYETFWKHRKILFKTNYNMFGIFVIPFFLGHIVLSFSGFFVFLGVLLHKFFNWFLYTFYTVEAGENIVRAPEIYLLPNVFTVFGILLIFIFLWGIILSLRTLKKASIKIDWSFIVYALFYLASFPIILIVATYKWLRGYKTW
jgi:cellulose synthase/poly-beta-1,6-N-acetylglucosamine synthase-like glycosyltransferase